jgi:hypothetical protein
LKASVTAPAVSPLVAAVSTVASISEVLAPSTATSPSGADSVLRATRASTADCTRFVTTCPPPAITVPLP